MTHQLCLIFTSIVAVLIHIYRSCAFFYSLVSISRWRLHCFVLSLDPGHHGDIPQRQHARSSKIKMIRLTAPNEEMDLTHFLPVKWWSAWPYGEESTLLHRQTLRHPLLFVFESMQYSQDHGIKDIFRIIQPILIWCARLAIMYRGWCRLGNHFVVRQLWRPIWRHE